MSGPLQPSWPVARTVCATITSAGLALLVAACGSTVPGSSRVASLPSPSLRAASDGGFPAPVASGLVAEALAYAKCMRSHGVPDWPDPDSTGAFPKRQLEHLGDSDAQLQAGQTACLNVLPNGGVGPPTQAQVAQAWMDLARFATCMRSHGVTDFPDPTDSPQHPERPTFDLAAVGLDPNSPQVSRQTAVCQPLLQGASDLQNLGLGGS